MTDHRAVEQAVAQRLWEAAESHIPCSPIRNALGEDNIPGADRIQYANARRRIESGVAHVGSKSV